MKMKLNKINVSLAIATIGVVILLVNKAKKKKLAKEVLASINSDENISGGGQDLGNAPYMNPNFYFQLENEYGKENVLSATIESLDARVGALKTYLDKTDVPEDKVLLLFNSSFQSQSQVSRFADRWQKFYGVSLWDSLKDIDNTLFGLGWRGLAGEQYLPKIKKVIESKPIGIMKNGKIVK